MFRDLDVHEESNSIVLFRESPEGSNELDIFCTGTRQIRFSTSEKYVPLSPRISPIGDRVAFGCMDGKIYSMNMVNGTITTLVNMEGMHSSFGEWSADGSTLCFSSYKDSQTPPNIYTINANSDEITQHTDCGNCIDRFPQISPCGRFILFTRQYLDEPNMPKRAMLLNVTTGKLVQLPQRDGTNYEIGRGCWSGDSEYFIVNELTGHVRSLHMYSLQSESIQRTIEYPNLQGGVFFNKEKKILVICKHKLLVVSVIDGQIERIIPLPEAVSIAQTQRGPATVLNSDSTNVYFCNEVSSVYRISLLDGNVDLIVGDKINHQLEMEEYEVVSYDGFNVPVHHYKPEMAKVLGILFVIGGPGERIDSDDPILLTLFNGGYEVIAPAYRGCAGYGEDFKNANIGLYGKGDVEDIIACAKDWKIRNDNRPLAIVGYSYGGFLTFLSMAHDRNPFEKGATLWGVTSLEHMGYHLPRAFPSDPIEKRKAKMKRNPINLAQNIQKPLLVLHGGLDTMSTNEEVLTIKQDIDKQKGFCEVIIYEDGAHGLSNYRKELFKKLLSFLER